MAMDINKYDFIIVTRLIGQVLLDVYLPEHEIYSSQTIGQRIVRALKLSLLGLKVAKNQYFLNLFKRHDIIELSSTLYLNHMGI